MSPLSAGCVRERAGGRRVSLVPGRRGQVGRRAPGILCGDVQLAGWACARATHTPGHRVDGARPRDRRGHQHQQHSPHARPLGLESALLLTGPPFRECRLPSTVFHPPESCLSPTTFPGGLSSQIIPPDAIRGLPPVVLGAYPEITHNEVMGFVRIIAFAIY